VLPPPPDPAAGWEAFAASRLEFTPEAAVPVDMLLLAYMRWCGAHGATVRTGSLSHVTAVEGVRVVV